jgi:gluconate kinase
LVPGKLFLCVLLLWFQLIASSSSTFFLTGVHTIHLHRFAEGDDYHPKANVVSDYLMTLGFVHAVEWVAQEPLLLTPPFRPVSFLYLQEKMRGGTPLTDEDRWPWLDKIADDVKAWSQAGSSVVLACSALKRSYRDRLRANLPKSSHFLLVRRS